MCYGVIGFDFGEIDWEWDGWWDREWDKEREQEKDRRAIEWGSQKTKQIL